VAIGVGMVAVLVTTVAPSGASTVNANQYGFSFSLPAKWTQINLDGKDIAAVLKLATKNDPSLTNVLNNELEQAAKSGLIKIFAVGPLSGSFFPNLNIIVQSAAGAPTGQAFLAAATVEEQVEFGEAGAHQIKVSTVRLPIGQAVRTTYVLPFRGSSLRGLQLVFEHLSHIYIVSVGSTNPEQDVSVARSITESWRWT
jgi:hypothetical protein